MNYLRLFSSFVVMILFFACEGTKGISDSDVMVSDDDSPDIADSTLDEDSVADFDNGDDTETLDVDTTDSVSDNDLDNDPINEADSMVTDNDQINTDPFTVAWIKQCPDEVTALAVDNVVNIYMVGATALSLDGNTNAGYHDIFLVKWDDAGKKIWTKQWGSVEYDAGISVAVKNANVFVSGTTMGPLDGFSLPLPGQDAFLSRIDTNGSIAWTVQWGKGAEESAESIVIDNDNNVYTTGYADLKTDGTVDPEGLKNIILQKRNTTGTLLWEKQWGTDANDFGECVAIDSYGNIYVTGSTMLSLDGNTNPNEGWNDVFLTKWNADGTKAWTKQWGTTESDSGKKITIDKSDNIYIMGYTYGAYDGYVNTTGEQDIVLTKFSSEGTLLWIVQWGTDVVDEGEALDIDSSGNIYIAGKTKGMSDGHTKLGSYDIFLTKWTTDGTKAWTKQWGTEKMDWVFDMAIDASDNIYIAGYGPLDYTSSNSQDNYAPFLMKIVSE